MDNTKDSPKARRPLPTPGSAALPHRPDTPVNVSPIPASSFYSQRPSLPARPKGPGSKHTEYIPPIESPPRYNSPSFNTSTTFREPELVSDDKENQTIAAPVPTSDAITNWTQKLEPTAWDDVPALTEPDPWTSSGIVAIDGRDRHEELNWWNPEERFRGHRPGAGFLPPVLADCLHNPEHTLFSVSVTPPDIQPRAPAPATPLAPGASRPLPSDTASTSSSASSSSTPPPVTPPTAEEICTAVPHPNAYYCPKEHGWVILSWKSSSVTPPLARSFIDSDHPPLPNQDARKRTASCIGLGEQPFGQSNLTHHFHKYAKAVDSHKLTPPYKHEEWEVADNVKQRRREGTIVLDDFDITKLKEQGQAGRLEDEEEQEEDEGRLLDLYVCCQCSFYCVGSGVIPAVIPRKHWDDFILDKRQNPALGKTPDQTVNIALETILLAMENKLWKGENRMIKTSNVGFRLKVGWNANVKRVFDIIGFKEEAGDTEPAIRPPITEPATPQGKINRRKLLRAWVEIGSYLADLRKSKATEFKDMKAHQLHVMLDPAREMYQSAIGAHPDQIRRVDATEPIVTALQLLHTEWDSLGLTYMCYSPDLLTFAYLAQCRCDPVNTVTYFTHLTTIIRTLGTYAECPQSLQEFYALEQSRDRFTHEDLVQAAKILGFGMENVLGVDYDDEIPDNFVENAWKDCVKRSWRDVTQGSNLQREANNAFRILAEARGSPALKKKWEVGKIAYNTLEIPKDVDDTMLITVFNMRLEETPLQADRMREALTVIAEVRNSDRLRQFLETGQDPGDIVAIVRPDFPRGLNQLGNTCYLNSLLQYFYTIKDLRDAVLPMSKLDLTSLEEDKLSDEKLARHRVGGRQLSRREIVRSKKFISQLAELFFNLEYAEASAVTPSIELAKLALVTPRDEDEDEASSRATDSSNDTDATLVEDVPRLVSSPTRSSSSSVLGKRPREIERRPSAMDVDNSPPIGAEHAGSPLRDSSSPPPLEEIPEASSSRLPSKSMEQKSVPPPLPARKRPTVSDSTMMFGKQHDVAECMDNCIFQLEAALLQFGDDPDAGPNIIKRLFYGKTRQRITPISEPQQPRTSISDREDLFSHLHVNVTDEGIDIYDGLGRYFDDEVDHKGGKARMEVSLVELPPILQIQLQRVQFNRETLQPFKSQAYIKFGETIYMDRFMDNADLQKKARSKEIQLELTKARERVRLLVEGKETPVLSALEQTEKFLVIMREEGMPDVDEELMLQLSSEKAYVRDEIDNLRTPLWRDDTNVPYELTSVFIHRGSSPTWGHYFFYSRHLPDAPDSWFKYNDSDVSVVSKDEVLADTTGSTANPYLLVFARKGSNVVDTVKRFDASKLEET
ncbi:hypothetical protein BDQ17DRAFT_1345443 [Cyathus striatus]|nr:hypothetical protein BDQ17DRAFT_1345443 [Cyathus striatus]